LAAGPDTLAMGPDLFMDGRSFDAAHVRDYVEGFVIRRPPSRLAGPRLAGDSARSGVVETAV
jgi:hypothetical protein